MTTYYISYYTFPYVGSSLASIVKSYQDNFDDTLLNPRQSSFLKECLKKSLDDTHKAKQSHQFHFT